MIGHILPNVLGPVLVIATLNLGLAILDEATLSFLGVGLPPTQPSLGTLIRIGNDFLFSGEWWVTDLSRHHAGAAGARDQPAGRLAARRAESAAALMTMALLEVERPGGRVPHPPRRAAGAGRGVLRHRRRRGAGRGRRERGRQIADRGRHHRPAGAARPHRRRARSGWTARASTTCRASTMRPIRGRQIGAIFQDPLTTLNPLYSVGRQLVETMQTHLPAVRPRRPRARDPAGWRRSAFPPPAQRIDAYPHEFSGGMRQRVVIALALCAEPRLVIADEPTTALDVSIQAQIITLLKRLTREHGTAVMLVTHDMGVIAETADRVAVMYAGRIAEIGPVRAVVQAAGASLHRRPDGQHSLAGAPRRAAAPDRRRHAAADRDPAGLRLQPALPEGRSTLPRASVRTCCRPAPPRAACWLHARGAGDV